MDIAHALREASEQASWSPVRLASEAGVSETTARRWLTGKSTPPGDRLEILRRCMPGLKDLLDGKAAVA